MPWFLNPHFRIFDHLYKFLKVERCPIGPYFFLVAQLLQQFRFQITRERIEK